MMSPCFGCIRRRVGCHGVCDKYIDFRKQLDSQNDKSEREYRGFLIDKKSRVEKMKRNHVIKPKF